MQDREKPSWPIRIFGPLLFVVGGIAALVWFFYRAFLLITGISSEVVILEKGSFYMLGVGVGLLALAFAGILESWLWLPLTKKTTSIISGVAIAGVVFTFAVPQIIHYAVNSSLTKNGYAVCEEASHQWLFVRDIVYIRESVVCAGNLVMQKN